MWSLPWDNSYKQPLWQLALDCFAMFGHARYGGTATRCLCNTGHVSRAHAFWDCPVAEAVLAELQQALPAGAPLLTRQNLWLLQPPACMQDKPWYVVALAAITAMDRGKRTLTALYLTSQKQQRQQPAAAAAPPPAAPAAAGPPDRTATGTQVLRACIKAGEAFWAALADFTVL